MITILYFARLREALGTSSEALTLPQDVVDLAGVRAVIVQRGEPWSQALASSRRIRAAVNQDMAADDTPVKDGDEVAFFPPVTGG